jgi:hypothetical protein
VGFHPGWEIFLPRIASLPGFPHGCNPFQEMHLWRSVNRPDLHVGESLPLGSGQVDGVPTIGSYPPCLRIAPESRDDVNPITRSAYPPAPLLGFKRNKGGAAAVLGIAHEGAILISPTGFSPSVILLSKRFGYHYGFLLPDLYAIWSASAPQHHRYNGCVLYCIRHAICFS